MYNYEDALEATVTKAQALREVKRHQCDEQEFLQEVGDKEAYVGSEILQYLGY